MNAKQAILVLVIVVGALIAACQPLPTPRPKTTETVANTTFSQSASTVPANSGQSASSASSTASSRAVPTATPPPVVEEEDCMAACHIPDPNDFIAAGATPQPASHVNRTTCLNCHATMDKPALPPTHVGRMDPSCIVCHVESAK